MAFSKAKALQHAEKSVAQGKIGQAIKLYLEILEHDASDLSLYNTVGDLYIRDRRITEGLKQFHRLAQAYVIQGFNVKAIAIYRKIFKIDPNSVDVQLKLAELYQLQGLGREAREQYLQAVEFFKRRNNVERTLDALRRLTLLDPENITFRNRLAEECELAGRREEAVAAYLESGQASLRRSDLASADNVLKKAAALEPMNSKVQWLRARVAISRQQPEEAEKIIESSPELGADWAGQKILLEAYLSLQKLSPAQKLVREIFRAHPSDFAPVSALVDLCLEKDEVETAFQLLSDVSDQAILMHGAGPLIESLRRVWTKFPQHIPTLQLLHRVCERAADELSLPEVLEALGQAYLQIGDLEKAEEVYQKLSDREPQNEQYRGRLEEILWKLGKKKDGPARPMEFAAKEKEVAPQSRPMPVPADDAQQAMVKEALDNSDLFARYHLVEKAVGELEKVLRIYPDQREIHERILELCRQGHPERAAAAASALARIAAAAGDEAAHGKYQAIASGETETPSPSVAPVATKDEALSPGSVASKPREGDKTADVPASGIAATEGSEEVSAESTEIPFDIMPPGIPSTALAGAPPPLELDLSGDLEAMAGLFSVPPPLEQAGTAVKEPSRIEEAPETPPGGEPNAPPATPAAANALDPSAAAFDIEEGTVELDFYVDYGFINEAWKTVAKLEAKFPGDRLVAELRRHLNQRVGELPGSDPAREATGSAPEAAPVPKSPAGKVAAQEERELPEPFAVHPESRVDSAAESPPTAPGRGAAPGAEEFFTKDQETGPASAGNQAQPAKPLPTAGFMTSSTVREAVSLPPAAAPPLPEPAVNELVPSASPPMDLLGDMAPDLPSLLDRAAAPEEPAPSARAVAEPAAPPPGIAQLSSLLEEMEDSGGGASSADDPETHYSLGVAFREMGLLDEAIGEFQKVVRLAGKGNLPPNFLQACSLLAICFMDKKMPAIAVKWYLRALSIPGLDEEATLALEYDLGVAYQLSGDSRQALERFTEVYSQNIDFRDVTEKVRELQAKDR